MGEYLITKIIQIINFVLEIIHRKEFKKIEKNKNVLKVLEIYKDQSYASVFSKTRFLDSPYIEIEKKIPKKGNILDLGCGEGLFSNYLASSSKYRKIMGIDIDMRRIDQADKGLSNTKFIHGDVTRTKLNNQADVIIMFHLLHHLESKQAQEKFIKSCINKLGVNGKFFIIEVEPKFSYKFFLAYFVDHFLVPWLFEKRFYSRIYFRRSSEWRSLLERYGLKVETEDLSKGKPFSHVLISGLRVS